MTGATLQHSSMLVSGETVMAGDDITSWIGVSGLLPRATASDIPIRYDPHALRLPNGL